MVINKKAGMALTQIFLLVIGTMAFAFALGGQIGFVSAEEKKYTVACFGETRDYYVSSSTQQGYFEQYLAGYDSELGDRYDSISECESLWSIFDYNSDYSDIITNYFQPDIPFDSDTIGEEMAEDVSVTTIPATNFKASSDNENQDSSFDFGEQSYVYDVDGNYIESAAGRQYNVDKNGWFEDDNKNGVRDAGERANAGDFSEVADKALGAALGYGTDKYLKKQAVKKVGGALAKFGGQLLKNAGVSLGISATISGALQLFGVDPQTSQGVGAAFGTAYMTYSTLTSTFGPGGLLSSVGGVNLGLLANPWVAGPIALAVGFMMLRNAFAKEDIASVTFECKPWKPPVGGFDCDKCNENDVLGCSEYQCMSLGTQCKLINQGTSEQKCIWDNRGDISPPLITAWKDILPLGYNYVPDPSLVLPHEGVILKSNQTSDGCLPAFKIFAFGVALNKDGICRIDKVRTPRYEDMDPLGFAGNSMYRINHSQVIMYPGQTNMEQEGIPLPPGGEYKFFVRCEGANGVSNTAEFGFKFCIEDEDDISEPQIYGSDPASGSPLAWFNETEAHEEEVTLYVDEPSECKWDHLDRTYDEMENSMTCATSLYDLNAEFTYPCTATLTGLENNKDNKFYFRCKDQPHLLEENKRNVMKSSHPLTLIGTRALSLSNVEPNETTIKGSTGSVNIKLTAKTSAGYNLGKATCEYKEIDENRYTKFENTDSHSHSSNIWLIEGDYEYYVRCYDLGGNFDKELISFSVESDTIAPIVVRAFHESSSLKIITNEEATCVYDIINCNYPYDEGTAMNSASDTTHYTSWNTNVNYYIKCEDEFGNKPNPDECSIVVRPMEI